GLHVHRSVRASVRWIGTSSPRLNAAAIEVENGFVRPCRLIHFRSEEIPVSLVSARPRRNINAGASSEDFTHGIRNRSSIQVRIWFSHEAPIQFAAKRHWPTVRIRD